MTHLHIIYFRGPTSEAANLSPSAETFKALNNLESLTNNKHYHELRSSVELAVRHITDANNSLHNASFILGILATELYQQQYLQVLKVSEIILHTYSNSSFIR